MIGIADNNKETKHLSIGGDDTGVYSVVPQKRFRPFRTQTRAGEPGRFQFSSYILIFDKW